MTFAVVGCAAALALLGHGFLWTGIVNRLHGLRGPRPVIKFFTALCVLAFAGILFGAIWDWATRRTELVAYFRPSFGAAAYVWACTALGAAATVVKPLIERSRYDRSVLLDWSSEVLDARAALGHAPLHGVVATVLGRLPGNEVITMAIDRKRLALPRLPAELEGLTIAHLSDFHMTGRIGREYFAYVAQQVNALRPDVVAITGDIVEREACWPWLAEALGVLCAPLGVYFILGNHDLFIDEQRTQGLLVDAGLTCLSGRWQKADWNGVSVTLGGNELPWQSAPRTDPQASPRPADGAFRIALCHSPDQFGWCCRAGVDLALAGHTHGGQVQLPVLGVIASPSLHGTRYACGVFRRDETVMHVTRGVSGQTPFRWRCPPEAALLQLTRTAES